MSFFYFSKREGQDCLTVIFSMEFLLDDHEFYCVVYARKLTDFTQYSITLLNEEGDEVLPQPFVLVEKDGRLNRISFAPDDKLASVKQASAIALEVRLSQKRSAHQIGERYIA